VRAARRQSAPPFIRPAESKGRGIHAARQKTLTLFILPGYLLYAVFVLLPIACVVAFSFTNMNGIIPGFSFIGWSNWQKLLTDTG
jgi:ABC-type sugar transport system permease subunit